MGKGSAKHHVTWFIGPLGMSLNGFLHVRSPSSGPRSKFPANPGSQIQVPSQVLGLDPSSQPILGSRSKFPAKKKKKNKNNNNKKKKKKKKNW